MSFLAKAGGRKGGGLSKRDFDNDGDGERKEEKVTAAATI